MHRLLRVISQDLRDYADGELPLTREALHAIAGTVDDIARRVECGETTAAPPGGFSSSRV